MRQLLVQVREQHGYSIEFVAEKCGITASEYLLIEVGAKVSLETAVNICKLFGIELQSILNLFENKELV